MSSVTGIASLLGPLGTLLDAPDVVEISCNPDGRVFVERFGRDPEPHGHMDARDADRFIRWCATLSKTRVAEDDPIFSGRIPGTAHRIEALVPPVVEAPAFSIRRHSTRVITLADFVPEEEPKRLIGTAIAARRNILIAGATGSGKTTLLNACLDHLNTLAPETRLVVIEDTPEIRSPFANSMAIRTADRVTMDRLLVSALRLAPRRIIVGEVREGAVLMTLLKAWNTGHPGGLVTLHANGADEVMGRLAMLATEVTPTDQTPFIRSTTDMIVFVRRGRTRPEVATITCRTGSELETTYAI